jgi:AcrR family transcriptional regulator
MDAAETTESDDGERPLRADARRNRARILEVASEAFAAEGLSVPVQEIARRAGVGTGTVSRHFPTKEALFEAVLLSRAGLLAEQAAGLARSADPGAAFFEFFSLVIAEGAANQGLAEALAGSGYDLGTIESSDGVDIMGILRDLLGQAQRAGAVRGDVDAADVKALIAGCLARTSAAADPEARDRMVGIARRGLATGSLAARPDGGRAQGADEDRRVDQVDPRELPDVELVRRQGRRVLDGHEEHEVGGQRDGKPERAQPDGFGEPGAPAAGPLPEVGQRQQRP